MSSPVKSMGLPKESLRFLPELNESVVESKESLRMMEAGEEDKKFDCSRPFCWECQQGQPVLTARTEKGEEG